jgi:phosphoribosylanthranilate isomerase
VTGSRTLVKICGLNRLADLEVAIAAGADLVGFIFVAWSPRAIAPAAAAPLAARVPAGIAKVGVFVDEDPDTVAVVADELELDFVQLHGDEPPAMVERFGERAIKAHRLPRDGDLYGSTILLDRHFHAVATAEELREHWLLARKLAATKRVLLAGALDSRNVGDAVRTARPWAVDGVRGTEREPGVKDHDKIRSFVRAVREAA